jgi:hypothetical protein
MVFFLFGSAGTLFTAALILGVILTVTGAPDGCRNSNVVANTNGAAAAERKWTRFAGTLAREGFAQVTLTEQEVTGRANRWIEDRRLPVEDLRVFFCGPDEDHPDGQGQMTASIGVGPLNTDVLVDATLDTDAEGEEIRILDVRAGNLPGFATGWAEGRVQDLLEDAAVDFEEDITTIYFEDGTMTLVAER